MLRETFVVHSPLRSLIAVMALLPSACSGSDLSSESQSIDEAAQALLASIATGDVTRADSIAQAALTAFEPPTFPSLAFALSVYAYLRGDDALLERTRPLAFRDAQSSRSTREWIAAASADSIFPTHFLMFIQALGSWGQGDTSAAISRLERARAAPTGDDWRVQYSNTLTALVDSTSHISMGIPSDDPLTYSGDMRAFNGGWLPVEGEFQIDGGSMVSFFGSQPESRKDARFGGWTYARVSGSDSILGWAATFVSGALYIEAHPTKLTTDSSDLVPVRIESEYDAGPVDYWGKFKLVTLDPEAGHSFPMLQIPFYKADDGSETATTSLGTAFWLDPKHFFQGAGPIRFFGGSSLRKVVNRATQYGRVYQADWF